MNSLHVLFKLKFLFSISLTEGALTNLKKLEIDYYSNISSSELPTTRELITFPTIEANSSDKTPPSSGDSRYASNYSNYLVIPNCTDHKRFDLTNHSLKKIPPGMFDTCPKVCQIDLNNNNLTTLPDGIFQFNGYLEKLNLSRNLFETISPEWFKSCERLRSLDLSHNCLSHFPVDQFPVMTYLKKLYLSNNKIIDIDERLIGEKFDTLSHFEFGYNAIGCTRLKELAFFFDADKVKTDVNEFISEINGTCINDGEWATMRIGFVTRTYKKNIQKPTTHELVLYGLFSSLFVLIISSFVYFKQKLRPMNRNHGLGTDWGEYYQPATPLIITRDVPPTENLTVPDTNDRESAKYATVDKRCAKE